MKVRFFTGMLISLVLLSSGILFKAHSQVQPAYPKFKVAVDVQCDENETHQTLVEGGIKRGLRTFGDVQIVGSGLRNPLWDYRISVTLFKIPNFQMYAYSANLYTKVPVDRFDPFWQEQYNRLPAIEYPTTYIGSVGIRNTFKISEVVVADFDKVLQPVRDVREIIERTKRNN